MEHNNSSPNNVLTKFNANTVLKKLINGSVSLERVGQRIQLTEIQNLPCTKSPLPNTSNIDHRLGNGTPFKHTPSPQSYKMKITPLSRNRRLQDVIYEKQQCTPPCTTAFYNPFEICTEILQLPTVSPHLFKEVVSPSDKEDDKFAWTIDQLAVLHPTNIETSPFNQVDLPSDPEYERKAQEAIDRFFCAPTVVPSPWTNSSHSINIVSSLLSSGSYSHLGLTSNASPSLMPSNNALKYEEKLEDDVASAPKPFTKDVWSQTEVTLPPTLPEEIEKTLKPFCTFHQDQTQQEETDDIANMNNTTLRRKLLFSNEELANITPLCSPKNNSVCFIGEVKHCSPLASEPLPFEEDETVHPWGVSLIRPNSRLSRSQSPSSMSFIRYSLGENEEFCSSPFNKNVLQDVRVNKEEVSNCTRTREVSPVSLRGVSPIRCFPSSDPCMSHFSNRNSSSFERQGMSPSTQEMSLKPLAVITSESVLPPIPYKSSQISSPLIDIAHSQCNSFNSSLLQIHCISADSSMNKPSDDAFECCTEDKILNSDELNELSVCAKDKKLAHISKKQSSKCLPSCSSGSKHKSLVECQEEKIEGMASFRNSEKLHDHFSVFESHIKKEKTPPSKSTSICSYTNSSPQFSSSPIKSSNFNSSINYLSASNAEEGERAGLKSSPRFSESPPVSPIAWRMDEISDDFPESCTYKFDKKFLQLDQYPVVMEELNDESNLESQILNDRKKNISSNFLATSLLDPNSQVSLESIESCAARYERLSQTSTDMDVDSQPFMEGSTIDEATCGQDTGYHTGINSLQSTNYSLQTTNFTENKNNLFDNYIETKIIENPETFTEEMVIHSTSPL